MKFQGSHCFLLFAEVQVEKNSYYKIEHKQEIDINELYKKNIEKENK